MEHFQPTEVRLYTEEAKPGQFLEYFYPAEQVILKTNNFEHHDHRSQRTSKFFRDARDLQSYLDDLHDSSDNREDRPPASEELFFDSQDELLFDDIARMTRYVPPLTRLQRDLLRNIAVFAIEKEDNAGRIKRKLHERVQLIRGYCKDLKRRRYAHTYKRFTKVRAQKLDLISESARLHDEEIADKQLMRPFYYANTEPPEYTNLLLPARRSAIAAKYHQYASDPHFRRTYRQNVHFNVNRNVTIDDVRPIFAENHPTDETRSVFRDDGPSEASRNVVSHVRNVRTIETVEQVADFSKEVDYDGFRSSVLEDPAQRKPVPSSFIVESHVQTTFESDETRMMQSSSAGDEHPDEIVRHVTMIKASVQMEDDGDDDQMQGRSRDARRTYHPDVRGSVEIVRRVTTTKMVQFVEELRFEDSSDEAATTSIAQTSPIELDHKTPADDYVDRGPSLLVLPGVIDWTLRNVQPRMQTDPTSGNVAQSVDVSKGKTSAAAMSNGQPNDEIDRPEPAQSSGKLDAEIDRTVPDDVTDRAPGVLVIPGILDWLLRYVRSDYGRRR